MLRMRTLSSMCINCGKITVNKRERVTKAVDPEWRALHRAADLIRPALRVGLVTGVQRIKSNVKVTLLEEMLLSGRVGYYGSVIDWNKFDELLKSELGDTLMNGIERGAMASKSFFRETVNRVFPRLRDVDIPFSMENAGIASYVSNRTLWLATKIEQESMKAVESVVKLSFNNGMPYRDIARTIRDSIGLNEKQGIALANYRNGLIEQGYSDIKVQQFSGKYADELLDYRAELIARTETMGAVNEGQIQIWEQAREAGYIPDTAKKTWVVTPDDALCEDWSLS